jgi:hypothetical protein
MVELYSELLIEEDYDDEDESNVEGEVAMME